MTVDDITSGIGEYTEGDGIDYITFTEAVEVINRISSMILGLMVNVIIIGLPLIIALEICYLSFPVIREGCDNLYGRLQGKKVKVVGLVLRDAHRAIKISTESEGSTSPMRAYLGIKCKTVILCFIIVMVVLQGSPIVINFARRILTDIIKTFNNIL